MRHYPRPTRLAVIAGGTRIYEQAMPVTAEGDVAHPDRPLRRARDASCVPA